MICFKPKSTSWNCWYRLGVLLAVLGTDSGWCGQASNARLTKFQQFVNGNMPIKEAVVFREIYRTNGAVINKEWWRFGYQAGTWFVQRLIPATNGSSALVPRNSTVCGASFKQLWVVSDNNLESAPKDVAKGSLLDHYGAFYRSLMWDALSLGIPRMLEGFKISDAPVEWRGVEFKTTVASERGRRGAVLSTAPLAGQLRLGKGGLPLSAAYAGVGKFPGGTVTYEYAPGTDGIPESFRIHSPNGMTHYKFLSLTLGTNDLASTRGYQPSLFADMSRHRTVTLFTNEFAYTQVDGKSSPAWRPAAPKLGGPPPKLRGTKWFNTAGPLTLEKLHGKVVLLDFWGVFCGPCIKEFPRMEGYYEKYKKEGLVVIGISDDWGNSKRAEQLLRDGKVSYPNMLDKDLTIADMKTGYTAWRYVVNALPTYALIDRSGKLVWRSKLGDLPSETRIKSLLEDVPTN